MKKSHQVKNNKNVRSIASWNFVMKYKKKSQRCYISGNVNFKCIKY